MPDRHTYAATFEIVDANRDGYITAAELKQLMKALGDDITDEVAAGIVQEMDSDGDGDGKVSLEEFTRYMSR